MTHVSVDLGSSLTSSYFFWLCPRSPSDIILSHTKKKPLTHLAGGGFAKNCSMHFELEQASRSHHFFARDLRFGQTDFFSFLT